MGDYLYLIAITQLSNANSKDDDAININSNAISQLLNPISINTKAINQLSCGNSKDEDAININSNAISQL